MSFDLNVLFSRPPEDFSVRFQRLLNERGFPAELSVDSHWQDTGPSNWTIALPRRDSDPQSPGWHRGDEGLALHVERMQPNPEAASSDDIGELCTRFTHNVWISLRMSAGTVALLLAGALGDSVDGIIMDPQLALAHLTKLEKFRSKPKHQSLEERGFFMPWAIMTVADAFWQHERKDYTKYRSEKPGFLEKWLGLKKTGAVTPLRHHARTVRDVYGLKALGPVSEPVD